MEADQPLTAAQLDVSIRRLKQQRARATSPKEQRYRELLRDSLDLEIARLEREKARALAFEDQQRGALMRTYLTGKRARVLRSVLRHLVEARDAHLFLGPMVSEGATLDHTTSELPSTPAPLSVQSAGCAPAQRRRR